MSHDRAAVGTRGAAPPDRLSRVRQWLTRASSAGSHERNTLLLVAKSTVAACVGWVIAHRLMHAQFPAFAPFSAVLMMQVTVYQSVSQALRYVGAVVVGVALQGVLGFVAGPDLATFALVAFIALVIGRWRPLGTQGGQVVTAAFFAFSAFLSAGSSGERLSLLGEIVLLVLVGCAVGVLVNVVLVPPLRYRSAEYGVRSLAHSLCDLLSDMFAALQENSLEEERTRQWRHRAGDLRSSVDQARSSVETAYESLFYNPRRLLPGRRMTADFSGYRAVIDGLERVAHQVASMTRSLDQWRESEGERGRGGHGRFVQVYGDFLSSAATIARLLSEVDEDRLQDQATKLCQAAGSAQDSRKRLADLGDREQLPAEDLHHPYGVLLLEADRLMVEFQHTCDVLQDAVDRHTATRAAP
ncbi:aromatic acid exporter family protein [Streptomyces sp. RKND-216]|uniref:aromatic acid exporter family protein n=1 Tax=Streptomyces sp. RKND-216 TaxID=2562581 RepID=UPI001FFAD4E0|nr:aromatic acid exporter family protein [Streptomyces sp. RKND-216]